MDHPDAFLLEDGKSLGYTPESSTSNIYSSSHNVIHDSGLLHQRFFSQTQKISRRHGVCGANDTNIERTADLLVNGWMDCTNKYTTQLTSQDRMTSTLPRSKVRTSRNLRTPKRHRRTYVLWHIPKHKKHWWLTRYSQHSKLWYIFTQ